VLWHVNDTVSTAPGKGYVHMSVVLRDQKRGQRSSEQELKAENQRLRDQLCRLQRLAAMGTTTAMVAHEFNNILTPMMALAQVAQKRGDRWILGKAVRRAYDSSHRAKAICEALLGMADRRGEETQEVVLATLVDETLAAMARDPSKDGIRLVKNVPARLRIATRPAELKQVLLNLLMNARAAVKAGGAGIKRISISAKRRNGHVHLAVADTGEGIRPEDREKIFTPFYSTRDGEDGGSGLGLSVCQEVVRRLNGKITFRSEVGKGSRFAVALPAG